MIKIIIYLHQIKVQTKHKCYPKGSPNRVLMITNMVNLLIGLNYKEFQVLIWKFI